MSVRARKPTWCGLTTEEQLQSKQAILHKRAYVQLPERGGRTHLMHAAAGPAVLPAKARLIVKLDSRLCGWPAAVLASFLLACIAAAGMAAAALSGIDRAIRSSHGRNVHR